MKKRLLSVLFAGLTGVIFGVLYPEYILLPETYQYIEEMNCQEWNKEDEDEKTKRENMDEILYAAPNRIIISSRLFQFLTSEEIIVWKSVSSDKDMP